MRAELPHALAIAAALAGGAACDRPVADGPVPKGEVQVVVRAILPTDSITGPGCLDDCDDFNPCTLDSCTLSTGVCVHKAMICVAQDQCHNAGTCDPATGMCSSPAKTNGTVCNDGNACTRTDTCQSGACRGGNPVPCTAQDQCHSVGTCDPASGVCSNPVRTGGACNDGVACTYEDTCTSTGSCAGKPIVCMDDEAATRVCNGTSTCTVTPKPGAACDDGNRCTKGDVRKSDGTCAGMPYVCAVGPCLLANECDGNGGCKPTAKMDGTECDADQSKCTPKDICRGGVCVPDAKPIACVAKDCNKASCNPGTGNCEYQPTSGAMCGLTGCFTMGTCMDGVCSGKPKDCSAMAGACAEAACDALTGECVSAPKPNGTACSVGAKCSAGAVCVFGECELAPTTCPAATAPCKQSACEPQTGMCLERNRAAGASCDPGNSCMMGAVCDSDGNCIGSPAPNDEPCTMPGGQVGRCALGACVPRASTANGGSSGAAGGAGGGADAGGPKLPADGGGCSCRVGRAGAASGSLLLLGLAWLAVLARRRR
jgi:MYXO-CTERM domain-containing protein